MNTLESLLDTASASPKMMPFVHITDCFGLVNILREKKLEITHCEVMNEKILYMFYGKPAYRTKHNGNRGISANLPCCLIFKPNSIGASIKRIYPFDTGAFEIGLYSDFFHKKTNLSDFELPADIGFAQKIVSYFFLDNKQYFLGQSRQNVDVPPLHFQAEGLHELARTPSHPMANSRYAPDERATAIEIQLDQSVDLQGKIMSLILPQIALQNKEVREALAKLNPDTTIPYETLSNFDSQQLAAVIYDKVFVYFEGAGYFS
jgi:hypothetical protein